MPVASKNFSQEAKAWVQFYAREIALAKKVIVLGCGDGNHLKELLNAFPSLSIELIDLSGQTFSHSQVSVVSADSASSRCLVLENKSAWAGHGIDYALISARLRDRDMGDIKTINQSLPVQDQSNDAKIWRALREIVQ